MARTRDIYAEAEEAITQEEPQLYRLVKAVLEDLVAETDVPPLGAAITESFIDVFAAAVQKHASTGGTD